MLGHRFLTLASISSMISHFLATQLVEDDHFVDPVENSGRKTFRARS